ncbi:MAG: TRAP transporter small permease subunit [Deltaproteobacteria bacterium]|nr:MAG: TRAP transporter small permease subunit [Deltaproteobacteria bacterium]
MTRLIAMSAAIDRASDRLGSAMAWLVLGMVVLGSVNAVGRYSSRALGLNLNSNGLTELQWYLFAAVFLLGAAAALKNDAHVRVDVIFGKLSARTRTWIDLAGTLLFLLPFCAFALYVSMPSVIESWRVLEGSPDAGGLPRYPVKSLVPLSFVLLLVQGLSELIKKVAMLRGDLPLPEEASDE